MLMLCTRKDSTLVRSPKSMFGAHSTSCRYSTVRGYRYPSARRWPLLSRTPKTSRTQAVATYASQEPHGGRDPLHAVPVFDQNLTTDPWRARRRQFAARRKSFVFREKRGGSAYGIRTRVTGVRGRRPGPLDERATGCCSAIGMGRPGHGARTIANEPRGVQPSWLQAVSCLRDPSRPRCLFNRRGPRTIPEATRRGGWIGRDAHPRSWRSACPLRPGPCLPSDPDGLPAD